MAETQVVKFPLPPLPDLPSKLPAPSRDEPEGLVAYRANPGDERAFVKLRRAFREGEDWESMAKLLVLHSAHIERSQKISELCIQAYELFYERVRDKEAAAHALARGFAANPENPRAHQRLSRLYRGLKWWDALERLWSWRLAYLRSRDPAQLPKLHMALADLYEREFMAIPKAVHHLRQASAVGVSTEPLQRLIKLYLDAGAWDDAVELLRSEIEEASPQDDPARYARMNLELARVEREQLGDLGHAARHLQAAIKADPESVEAMRSFGELYLDSGKATKEGSHKAASILLKAAQLAHRRKNEEEALRLARRCLALRPDDMQAGRLLETILQSREEWVDLEELYAQQLAYQQGPRAEGVLLKRAELLETKLERLEDARICYEEAGQYQAADGAAWLALERIYQRTRDWPALAALLEYRGEHQGEEFPADACLRTAELYREKLDNEERAAIFYYKVLERDAFNSRAFEGYKEHFRRRHNWAHLRDLILYQIETAMTFQGHGGPLDTAEFAEEFVELADICERRLGDIEGALDAWRRLAECYPGDKRPRDQIARIEKRSRMWENMIRVQEAELDRVGHDPERRVEILKRLVQVYRDRQVDTNRAIELYNELLSYRPDDVQATRALTALYDRAGEYEHVITLLSEQYERSRSNTERIALLKRMAELWQYDLQSPEDAMWACEQLLSLAPREVEALHRLQIIQEEQQQYEMLLDTLLRELDVLTRADERAALLRRMARIAERELQDDDRAGEFWTMLLDLTPADLEVVDKMTAVYESSGRYEELATLLGKVAASAKTPPIRQLNYCMRLGEVALEYLEDYELARSAFEQALKIRPKHRAAAQQLIPIYRVEGAWRELCETLELAMDLADSEDEIYQYGWERAEVLAMERRKPEQAAAVLEQLTQGVARGNADVNGRLLEFYEAAQMRRQLITRAELMLLGAKEPEDRELLFNKISENWLELGNKEAALRAYKRFSDEFDADPATLEQLARLQVEVGQHAQALDTLERGMDLAAGDEERVALLLEMAEIAEDGLADPPRALELLRRAVSVDPDDDTLIDRLRMFAEAHGVWKEMVTVYDERFDFLADRRDRQGQLDVCMEASAVAEKKLKDPKQAFNWVRRAYFLFMQEDLDASEPYARLQQVAGRYELWEPMLDVTEQELAIADGQGERLDGDFETIERLLGAAEIAEKHLKDARRALAYLHRAWALRPEDEDLIRKYEKTAEAHEEWDALITLGESRLERAETALGRFDAHVNIASVLEKRKADTNAAFHRLRTAWKDLRETDLALAEDALDMAVQLAHRHELWTSLGRHHVELAREHFESGAEVLGIDSLIEASEIAHERQGDTLAALRGLCAGLSHDPSGEHLMPRIRELADALDDEGEKRLGSLVLLRALEDLYPLASLSAETSDERRDRRIDILRERAEIRLERLDDQPGAVAEFFRMLEVDPEQGDAVHAIERITREHGLWPAHLALRSWELNRADAPELEAQILSSAARVYEDELGKMEYAFRARLEAWQRDPYLPNYEPESELDATHQDLWRMADLVGAYKTPALPKDPLLQIRLARPELADEERWKDAGVDPTTLAAVEDEPGVPGELLNQPTAELDAVDEVFDDLESEFDPDLIGDLPDIADIADIEDELEPLEDELEPLETETEVEAAVSGDGVEEVVAAEEIAELVELEDSGAVEGAEPTSAPSSQPVKRTGPPMPPPPKRGGPPAPPKRGRRAVPPAPPNSRLRTGAPKPPPGPPGKLPPPPVGLAPLIPRRPSAGSAWEELIARYASVPAKDKPAQARVHRTLARVWEDGAKLIARAFESLEQALLLVPEDPELLGAIESLAERTNSPDRLLASFEHLLAEATLPQHIVAQNLRLATLHRENGRSDRAMAHYEATLAVDEKRVEALEHLTELHRSAGNDKAYVDTFARLINARRDTLEEDERVAQTLELANLQVERLDARDDAIETLQMLVVDFPKRGEVHNRLAELLIEQEAWPRAIEAMRTGIRAVDDPEYTLDRLRAIAGIYLDKQGLLDRAIETWLAVRELEPLDEQALDELQKLYEATDKFELLLPILDERLEQLDPEDPEQRDARIELLVAKARALQEGLDDEESALSTLEELAAHAPENESVVLGLARLYRRLDRLDDSQTLLRTHLDKTEQDDHRRRVLFATTLAQSLSEDSHDPQQALEVVSAALDGTPDSAELLQARARLARLLRRYDLLVDTLAALPGHDGLLEAAGVSRNRLDDPERAERLYQRVLDATRERPELGDAFVSAINGLVELKLAAEGEGVAVAFVDRQLERVETPMLRARLLAELGRITYETTGDMEAARARFAAALEQDPDDFRAKLGLGRVLLAAGDHEEAFVLVEGAVEALGLTRDQDNLVVALVLLAKVLEALGRAGDAYRRLSAALRHDPNNLKIRAQMVENRYNARRYRDVVTAADQLDQRIRSGELSPTGVQSRIASDIFVRAAQCEQELRREDAMRTRLDRALELDETNPVALRAAIPNLSKDGEYAVAAGHAATLAEQLDDANERGKTYLEAGTLYHEAASALEESTDSADLNRAAALRKSSFECVRVGLTLVSETDMPVLDPQQLELAFRASAGHHTSIALACLDRLLLHDELETEYRVELLLEGARLALDRATQGDLRLAEQYATTASSLAPTSSAVVLTQAAVLELTDRSGEVEALVTEYFDRVDQSGEHELTDLERADRVALLIRLSEIQKAHPKQAMEALERALELDERSLQVEDRKRLALLYDASETQTSAVLRNHKAIVADDPVHLPSLRALAEHYQRVADHDKALAFYRLLALLGDEELDAASVVEQYSESSTGEPVALDDLVDPEVEQAGVPEALALLWESSSQLLSSHVPRIEISKGTRVSPVGDSPLSRSWSEVLRRIGDKTKIALVDDSSLDEHVGSNRFKVRCQHPPVIMVGPAAREESDEVALRFELGRALYLTRPEAVFACLDRPQFAKIVSATLQAFHPRHSRRKHHVDLSTDETAQLSQELARKLPIRIARGLSTAFKDNQAFGFDSREWRNRIAQRGNRVGLAVAGELEAALRAFDCTGPDLHERVATDADLRALVAFAISDDYIDARRAMGVSVSLLED